MKKRILSLLMVCGLLCAMVVPARAASASLSGSSELKPGDSVELTLKVSDSTYGLSGTLTYSDNLTFTNYRCSVSSWSMEVNGTKFSAFGTSKTSGAILTVTLKVSSSAKAGDTISASFKNIEVTDSEDDTPLNNASWSGTVGAPPSNNADLDLIMCTSGTLSPAFNKNTTYYTVTVPYSVQKLSLDYNRADKTQTVTISGNNNLVVGENVITFTVRAAAGNTKTYTLVATRQQDPNYKPSTDASLKSMTLEGATLSPAFDPKITEYVAYVPYEQRELTLSGVPNDAKAVGVAEKKVELDRAQNIPAFDPVVDDETGASAPVTTYLAEDNTVTLVCTAEDGVTRTTYTVHIVRMPAYTGGVPQIHMTNEKDLAQPDDTEPVPEEEKPIEVPRTLTLPLVGEMSTTTVAIVGGAVVLVVLLLTGFLLGRIGRGKIYEDEPDEPDGFDDDDDDGDDDGPGGDAPAEEPARPLPPAEPPRTEPPAKPFYDFDDDADEFERLLESTPAPEHRAPAAPSAEPAAAPETAPAEPDGAGDGALGDMSLDDLLNDIRNM